MNTLEKSRAGPIIAKKAYFSYYMGMKAQICTDKGNWDEWLPSFGEASFLQSFDWGEFQTQVGNKPFRIKVEDNNQVIGQMQGFEHKLGLGMKYLYVPRFQISDLGLQAVIDFLNNKGYMFTRLEPMDDSIPICNLKSKINNENNRQPKHTLILDLTKSEETLLDEMHSKTRYNIRLAERKGVEIRQEKDMDIFWKLNEETTGRDKFKSHDKRYYKKMLESNFSYQLIGYFENRPIASNILIKFGKTITYLHGASSSADRNLMAPYLLQWEGVRLGKELGCKHYDFWGVADKTSGTDKTTQTSSFHGYAWDVNDRLTGVTRFKAGFGGEAVSYPGAFDVVLKPFQYKVYKLAKKIL